MRLYAALDAEQVLTLSRLLDHALDLTVDQRLPWVDGLTDIGDEVRQKLHDLLAREEQLERDDFLGTLPELPIAYQDDEDAGFGPRAGDEVGAYRLVREIGKGGMASVWLAERVDGRMQRQIALKLPHAFPGSHLAERLDRERDILAALTHPNIARLYDAGVSPCGQPFMAMEYVEGVPLLAHCDTQRLGVHERLRLFIQILAAVRYAHSRLVIHRDLKPSNILVTEQNEISLLDFGIAKLLVDGETQETELTLQAGRALTVSYASPEQIAGMPLGTGTDIYSLGVILYELLTGLLPYRLKRNSRGALEEAILDSALTRPSQGVRPEQADYCGIAPAKLVRSLRGDLDAIVGRALRKAPTERYADAHEFADDLERYLAHEPVRARLGARAYVLRRFARRNWRLLAATAAVFAILLAGIGAVAWQARIARTEAHKALAVKNFLLDIFRQNSTDNPNGETARHTTAEQLLDISGKKIVSELRDQPEVRGEMLMTLGDLYNQLELFDKAELLARERLDDLRRRAGGPSAELAEAEVALGRDLAMEGEYPQASDLLKQALSSLNQIQDFSSPTRAHALLELGRIGYHTKPVDDAETLQQLLQAAELYRQCCADSPEQLATMQMLARLAESRHDFTEAEQQYRRFLALARSPAFAAQAPIESGHAYEDLGSFLLVRRRYVEAQANLRQAVDIYIKFLGVNSMDTANAKASLGRTLMSLNRPVEGEQLLGEALHAMERTQGTNNVPSVTILRLFLAAAQFTRGEVQAAGELLKTNAQIFKVTDPGGSDHCPGQCVLSLSESAKVLMTQGAVEDARRMLAMSNDAALALHARASERYGVILVIGARLDALQGHTGKAVEDLHRIIETWPATAQDLPQPYVLASLAQIEISLQTNLRAQAVSQALALLDQILALPDRSYFADWESRAQRIAGVALAHSGQVIEGEAHLRRALELRRLIDVEDSPWLAETRISLADTLITENKLSEARILLSQASDAQSKQPTLGEQYRQPLRLTRARLARAYAKLRPHLE